MRTHGKHTEVVVIKVDNQERAVKVIVDAPYPAELDVQYLAQKAWPTRSQKLKRGKITVQVEKTDQ